MDTLQTGLKSRDRAVELTTEELIQARDVFSTLLEELALSAYLYEFEPRDEHYELKVECACSSDGEWASTSMMIPRDIVASSSNPAVRQQILDFMNRKLTMCKRRDEKSRGSQKSERDSNKASTS